MARFTLAMLIGSKEVFFSKLVRDGECLRWSEKKTRDGYGMFSSQLVHRLAYELFCAPIPAGMTVDHKCFTRDCCNPEHLRLLTPGANAANQRQKFTGKCRAGHERTEANTYWCQVRGYRMRFCRDCNKARAREFKERKRLRQQAAA